MVQQSDNYSLVFNRLCHMVAMSKEDKTKATVDNLVVTALLYPQPGKYADASQLQQAIQSYFGLTLPIGSIQAAMDRLQQDGTLLRDPISNLLIPDIKIKAETTQRVEEAASLEHVVRQEWLDAIVVHAANQSYELPMDWEEELWTCLQLYVAKAFRRHGVQTVMLLNPDLPVREGDRKNLSTYLVETLNEKCITVEKLIAEQAIRSFFEQNTSSRTRYLSQLLDATFTFFALTVDDQTSEYLRRSVSSMSIFLDTNIIFGILDLHENPLNDVAQELVALIQTHKLPFKMYYHEETLKEIQNVINSIGDHLRGRRLSQALSRAAIRDGRLSNLELKYHQKNKQAPLDPEVFLSQYRYVQDILEEKGFTIYRVPNRNTALDEERHKLVADYNDFLEQNRPNRPKPYPSINHDVAVWQTVRGLRKKASSPLEVGAFLLTADYSLYTFDWYKIRQQGEIGLVVLPNQFLQILRPFVSTTDDFDRRFVETFAIPEFRTLGNGYASVRSRVLSYLSTYADMTERTALRILANELLMQQLRDKLDESEEFKQSVEFAIFRDYEQVLKEKEESARRAKEQEELARSAIEEAKEREEQLRLAAIQQQQLAQDCLQAETKMVEGQEQLTAAVKEARANAITAFEFEKRLQTTTEEKERIVREADRAKAERARVERLLRIVVGVFVVVIGILLILTLPSALNWQWFQLHPKRIQLNVTACIAIAAIGWAIAETNSPRRWVAIGSFFVGAVLTALQIS